MRTANLVALSFLLPLLCLGGCAATGGGALAHFTPENSQEIALSPYYLADPAQGGDHAWYMKLKVSDRESVAGFLRPNQVLLETFTQLIFAHSTSLVAGSLALPALGREDGCAGGYRGEIQVLEGKSAQGVLAFDHYAADCGMTLTGDVPFTFIFGVQPGELEARLDLSQLIAELPGQPLDLGGELKLNFNALKGQEQVFTLESTLALADKQGRRYRLAPVDFVWDYTGQYPKLTMNGSLVFDTYGRVSLATTSPLLLHPQRKIPFNGSLTFYGSDESWIRMLFAKPALPGFFRLDGSDALETIGQL